MSSFSNKQPGNKRPTSIDGFGGQPKVRFNQGPGIGQRFDVTQRSKPNREQPSSSALNNFSRSDGFHSTTQRPITRPHSHNDQPLFVDRNDQPKKRSRLKFWKRDKKQLSRNQLLRRRAVIGVALVMLITGPALLGYMNLRKVLRGGGGAAALQQNVDPSKLKGEGDGRVNILLLGRGGEGHEGADLTDTIILASIDPLAKEAALVSIPRDLYVPVVDNGSMKINAVFATGKSLYLNNISRETSDTNKQAENSGFRLLEDTLQETLGVPIHYHAMVDFAGFEKAIDTVGGVTVNAPDAVVEDLRINGRNYRLNVQPGVKEMGGFEALAYSRSRFTSNRGDFDRSERQRIVLTALKDEIMSAGTFGNPKKMTDLVNDFGNHVQTNFSVEDLQRLYQLSQQIPSDKISSVGFADPPNNYVTTGSVDGQSVVVPTAGTSNFKELQTYLRNVLIDSYLKNEAATVTVLNGTDTVGLATTKSDELKSFGYNVLQVGNAPTRSYNKTVVVDLRGGAKKYTRNYLEKRFGVPAVNSLPDQAIQPGTADFVIIIGNDNANQ